MNEGEGVCIGVTEGTQGEVHTRGKCEEGALQKANG